MAKTKEIIDEVTMKRAITRITYEIIERNKELDNLVIVGIKTRGVYIAKRIQERLKQLENIEIPLGELDTKPFRDDIKTDEVVEEPKQDLQSLLQELSSAEESECESCSV